MATQTAGPPRATGSRAYEDWIESTGVPIYKGYYIEDSRTLELGWWPERECNAAFLLLAGQEGTNEARITEIPPGKTLPPLKFALDERIYVVEGRGLCTVWAGEGKPEKTFEWQKHSLFVLPRYHYYQLTNTQGDRPVRLLHTNALPIGMLANPDPDFFFNNPYEAPDKLAGVDGEFYSEAKAIRTTVGVTGRPDEVRTRNIWHGNFFPDFKAWDKLEPYWGRGAGGTTVGFTHPGSPLRGHMSVFDAQTYKKGHRHGPGIVIIIPAGEGYSIMWPDGQKPGVGHVIPWHEGSIFVPPNRWFHQHFNVGNGPGRYLALSPARTESDPSWASDPNRQIEYPNEDPFIRETFEKELAKRGLKSIMPEECYKDLNFEWDYSADEPH